MGKVNGRYGEICGMLGERMEFWTFHGWVKLSSSGEGLLRRLSRLWTRWWFHMAEMLYDLGARVVPSRQRQAALVVPTRLHGAVMVVPSYPENQMVMVLIVEGRK